MTEDFITTPMYGIAALLATSGTIHSITPPPERGQFETDESYGNAYHAWWIQTHTWKSHTNNRSGGPPKADFPQ